MEEGRFMKAMSDCDLASMIDQLILQKLDLVCESNNPIDRVCINPNCQNALICSKEDCPHCGNNKHRICLSISLNNIILLLNQKISHYRQFVTNINEIDDQLIYIIRQSRREMINKHVQSLLGEHGEAIRELYIKKNAKQLNGKKVQDLYQTVTKEDSALKDITTELLQKYKAKIVQYTDQIIYAKRGFVDRFCHRLAINSTILTQYDYLAYEQLQYLKQILNQPKQLVLLYRASEHNFRADAFHKYCDGIPNTVTIVKTQYDSIIGGFTKYPWSSNGAVINDQKKEAFLFSLSLKQKMVPLSFNGIICCTQKCGPTFGSTPTHGRSFYFDLCLLDSCNSEKRAIFYFPRNYQVEGPIPYNRSQQTCKKLTGDEKYSFKALQYEVFEVIYE